MSQERVWKKPGNASNSASIEYVRPSVLAESKFTGVVLEGTFIESVPNSFDSTKTDFKFEKEDGSVVVINSAGNLGYRMRSVSPGDFCRVEYEGMKDISSGKMKGKKAHSFNILIA